MFMCCCFFYDCDMLERELRYCSWEPRCDKSFASSIPSSCSYTESCSAEPLCDRFPNLPAGD